ncbi:MAG TPA: C25 family cysteine peptidase [Candidatus Methylomirabilis sp.]|nr:C25 family cysteine peptidase [Candidatus Methylomirabilis sp.]
MAKLVAKVVRNSAQFGAVCQAVLQHGAKVRFRANGLSMRPNILNDDAVVIAPLEQEALRRGDIALTYGESGFKVHRIAVASRFGIITRSDAGQENDPPPALVLGKLVQIERAGRRENVKSFASHLIHTGRLLVHRLNQAAAIRIARLGWSLALFSIAVLLGILVNAAPAAGQAFAITDAAAPTTVAPGATITYTQVLSNRSGVTITHPIRVTQNLPANTTFVSAAKTGGHHNWTCALNAGVITCTDTSGGNYASGNNTTFTVVVTVNGGTPNGTVITDTVNAKGANAGVATASANVTVQTPDLSVSETAAPNSVATGANVTYTQTVTNNSATVAAAGATLTQNTPPGTLFQSVTPPAGWTCGTQPVVGGTGAIVCTANGPFAAATSATFTVVVSVSPEAVAGSTITNSVTVSETGTDPNPGNDTATASVQVQGADLSMTQVASATAIAPGSAITYTETVTNSGPNAATNAILYQQTPPNTTFASMTPPAGWTCGTQPGVGGTGTVLCTANAAMNANTTTGNFVFVVTVNAGATAGTSIVNSADVTSQTSDPNASNNATTTSVLVEITGDADLSLSMTAQPTPVFISSNLTYTIQIQDLGLSNTADGTLTDTIPAGTTFVSSASTQGSCSGTATVTCALGAINRGTPITVTITVTAPASPTTLTNTASVSSSTTDPVAANNSATVLTVVQPLVCASPGRDGVGGTLTGIVNTYYPPANAGTLAAGSTSVALGAAAAGGAQTPIAAGDLLLFIQAQDAAINSTNTGAYGDGFPGDPASGWTALNNSGNFEFVTATNAVPVGGGTLNFQGTGPTGGLLNTYTSAAATAGQGQRTYQIIRVPQYSSAVLSSGLTAMIWNGATGGVLALDVASQLTLGGTVAVDGLGFRGGGGRILRGGTGTAADYVTLSTDATNGSKGEGIAGTPRFVVSGPITSPAQAPTDTGVEGLPNGSYARGAPGTAGGGATDADPPANDQNSGGGGGGNGGTGGTGGFGWNSAGIVGGFGGAAFPVSTSALAMGGGGGAGTTNNGSYWNPSTDTGSHDCGANCTGIYSSGAAGGGIVIIHAGSVIGTGTISANGLSGLAEENDGGGGGGAGGTILVFSNSGGLGGLTANAIGGTGGSTWPEQVPGAFPGNRHGPGAGGGGGVILSSAAVAGTNVAGGNPGVSTLANDAYGATVGQPGVAIPGLSITQTPGTQSGAFCAGADLAVTNAGSPNPVLAGPGPGNIITYTQSVTNNGPQDSLNAVFSETIPANTTFQSLNVPSGSGWTCVAPAIGGTGTISCTNPDVPKAASTTFTVMVAVNTGVAAGTVITDIDNVTAGTSDPVLTNNSATVQTTVGLATTADLSITKIASPNPVIAGNNITYTVVVTNNGAAAASTVAFTDAIPMNTTFVSATPVPAAGWTCGVASGSLTCSNPLVAAGASTTFTVVVTVNAGTAAGTVITNTANVSSATTDPNPNNNSATATVVVATAGQADLSVTSAASPNPVTDGNNITYAQSVTNNGPAASGTATFTDAIPAGTTFVSFAVPAGWNCGATVPAVGGTGTISCSIASLPVNATANFPLVVKVSLGDTPGTTITNTANINVPCSSVTDPNCANNSATTNVTVASPTQADVAITKTASPEPVDQGTNLTYTLQVTNNGPALAVNVNVSDPLPSQVSFASVSTTQGTCTYTAATTTVNCALGNVSVGGLVLITINVTANTFSSSTLATNTATVSATTSDPNLTNNTSTVTSTIAAPTAVQLASFRAFPRQGGGVLLEWKTREEIRNLGFNVFRLEGDNRQRLNPSIIAGSALLIRGGSPQHAAKTYQWFDPQGTVQSTYLLEDVDLNGTRMPHGPISVDASVFRAGGIAQPVLLTQLNRATVQPAGMPGRLGQRLSVPQPRLPVLPPNIVPAALDGEAAVKISIQSEGWYQVTQAQLVAAGLDANADARTLKLYAEGVEQPLLILGRQAGPLGPNDSFEFYGTGIDTPFSGTRVYWLVSGGHFGKRIPSVAVRATGLSEPQSFPFTVVLQQRTTYFPTLLNGENNDNFFGAAVTSEPVDLPLTVAHADPNSAMQITLDITLQGATDQQAHSVSVAFNGASIGEMDFANLANVTNTFPVDRSLLQDGVNTVTLTALQGDNDISVVQSIALHYPHTYAADGDWLKATASAGEAVHISGFSNPQIQVFDITNPLAIIQLDGAVAQEQSGYGVTLSVAGPAGEERTLIAFSAGQISQAAGLAFHAPSRLLRQREGSEMVIITHPDFESSLGPLVSLHESRGTSVEVVTIDDVFDTFNYGERSPFAMRAFLQDAVTHWRVKPKYLLLVGDASLDPRNYLGLGDFDFVPTRMIETAAFKTASDDWFSDFQQSGFATIATGRIPARTAADAALVVSKIVNFEQSVASGSASQQALLVADQNIDADFSTATKVAAADLPSSLQPVEVFADGMDPTVVQQQLLADLNSGPLLVNYSGHGSVEQLSFADFLDDTSAATLTNSNQYSVYFLMDCLNGFFQDVYSTSLAESLLLAPDGGAAAVWASSGFTIEPPQASMNQALLQILKSNPSLPLGTAILGAKSGVTDNDVRRTWILFGDPAMVLLPPPPASAAGGRVPPRDGRRPNRDRTYR